MQAVAGYSILTISPDLGKRPCHLGIACARSTYAALVPVPSITAAMTSSSQYLPPAKVPIVSLTYIKMVIKCLVFHSEHIRDYFFLSLTNTEELTNAATRISRPSLSIALVNSTTTSWPTWKNGHRNNNSN